jgi:hypothetical protein
MAHESKVGRSCKVTLGANNILGMGTWEIGGATVQEHDVTEFGDDWEDIELGIITGGAVSFSGIYKADDTQGQDLIRAAFYYKSDLTDIRFYVDDTSYYTPNSTTASGGGLPANCPVSVVNITTEPQISVDKAGLVTINFSGRVVGVMRFI